MAARKISCLTLFDEGGRASMGAAGEQSDGMAAEAELMQEIVKRKFSKEGRNIIKDVLWGLHG